MIERSLNSEQLEAVTHNTGPLLIIAGAGTGKTTVITERIKWLILEQGLRADQVLALTFTEKAAREMQERVDEALPIGYTQTWILTFHGFCERVLAAEAVHIGLDPGYHLLSEAETQLFIREHLFELPLDYYHPKGNPNKFLGGLHNHFSRLKDEDITPEQYQAWVESEKKKGDQSEFNNDIPRCSELAQVYTIYEELKVKNSVMDFADLISNTLKLFRTRPNVLAEYQKRFPYILIDEFQDTNYAQNQLAEMLAAPKNNITVVADDDQSIYRWRGAAVYNVLDFQKQYSNSKLVTLITNYRSQQNILDHAYQAISNNNPDRLEVQAKIDKHLVSAVTAKKSQVRLIWQETVEEEADAVAKEILALKPSKFSDVAILVRANNHAEPFTRALARNGVPYQFLGPGRLFKQEEIKDLIAYLTLLTNLEDSVALYRVLTMSPFTISGRDLQWLTTYAKKENLPLMQILERLIKSPDSLGHEFDDESKNRIVRLQEMIDRHLESVKKGKIGEIVYYLLSDTGELLKMRDPQSEYEVRKVENISAFFNKIKEYEVQFPEKTLTDFVDYLNFLMAANESPMASQTDWASENAVNILTIHSAKGLEFETVFVTNLVDLRFPSVNRKDTVPLPEALIKEPTPTLDPHIAEERRLFYVALTRAKTNLYLTAAKFYHDGPTSRPKKLSPFIAEALGEDLDLFTQKKKSSAKSELSFDSYLSKENVPPTLPLAQKHKVTYLSYSQIETFDNCPLHYKLDYILQIPKLPTAPLTFGTVMHATLNDVYGQIMQGELVKDFDLVYPVALKFYETHWSPIGFGSKAEEEKRFEDGKVALHKFLEKDLARVYEIDRLEAPFTFPVGGNLKVGGRIDRIDKLPDGRYEIIDYKTGSKPDEKELQSGLKGLQLSIYALAAMRPEITNLPLERLVLTLHYLESGDQISLSRSEKDLDTAKDKMIEYQNKIEQSDFKCSKSFFCQGKCEYSLFCD